MELGIYNLLEKQLNRYTINNLMVRAYGRVAGADTEGILFPFSGIREGDTVVIYGAGALGRAVYQYAVSCGRLKVKALVDQNAEKYKRIGLHVCTLEETDIGQVDKVVVAVFSQAAYQAISEKLVCRDVKTEQIRWIDTQADRIVENTLKYKM